MSQTSGTSKTGAFSPQHIRDHFYVSMEVVPGTRTRLCRLHCLGCESKCDLRFVIHGTLRSVFVARIAGVFYSLCKKLGQAVEDGSAQPDGHPFLLSDVNEEK